MCARHLQQSVHEGLTGSGWRTQASALPCPPMPFVRHNDSADLMADLDALLAAPGELLLLFFGSEDPESGTSWCPDCVTADPILRAAIHRLGPQTPSHECPVGLRSAWKQIDDHPYRVHPRLRVARIPTLLRFRDGCEIGRLVEADCADPAVVAAFLTDG